ncbi:nuclear RNA export factor 1 [Drosophila miranda]|uniref:nuclear RNA export factor 1 n=1 Tax=Drosophila miranda TaxID=7229 RepID=UPI00143F5EA5|nr:nuclear RNA export factor 1 [Drosophila miranda]
MKIPTSEKKNESADRLGVQMKAQLKNNFQDKKMLNAYTDALIAASSHVTASVIFEKLDRICSQNRTTNKAIVRWNTVEMSRCGNVADAEIFLALKYLVMPEKLEPFNYKRNGSHGSFSLDNLLIANRVKRLQTKLNVIFSCQRIQIRVIEGIPEHTLNAVITSEFEAAAKDALHSSYDDATRTLNLSRFHAKPELSAHFCPLYVDKFLVGVLLLISKETPQVSKIVLSDNYLCSLKAFSVIPNGLLADLDCLDISSNKIGDLRDLQYLTNLKLKSLILQGNEVANLKNDILAILPQLQNLQGCRQSQNKENVSMGRPKLKLFESAVPENFVNTFIKDFYQFFDHPDQRSQLEQRYHELATFSLSVPDTMKHVLAYRLYNRNCKTRQSTFARSAKLQVGPKAVLHALGRLPKMETYLQGVNVVGQMSTAHVRIFNITGRFMEYSSTGRDLRNFQRSFVLELQESPSVWVIKNDMLCIIPLIEGKSVEPNIKALSESQVDSGLEIAAQMEQMNINMATPPLISTIPKSLREESILKEIKAVSPMLLIPPPELNEFENMPRLIVQGAHSHSNDQLLDKNDVSELEKEIDDTLLTVDFDELIINDEVLFAECDL